MSRSMMWEVKMCRIGYAYTKFQVEANTYKEAEQAALNNAGDFEYLESDADYNINSIHLLT